MHVIEHLTADQAEARELQHMLERVNHHRELLGTDPAVAEAYWTFIMHGYRERGYTEEEIGDLYTDATELGDTPNDAGALSNGY